jgi:hypothetical protein
MDQRRSPARGSDSERGFRACAILKEILFCVTTANAEPYAFPDRLGKRNLSYQSLSIAVKLIGRAKKRQTGRAPIPLK